MMRRIICLAGVVVLPFLAVASTADTAASGEPAIPAKIAPFFSPPPVYAGDFGDYRSPLIF